MSRPCKELKRMARETLNQRYSIPMGAFVAANVVTAVIEIPFSLSLGDYPTTAQFVITYIAGFLISLIAVLLNAGVTRVHLNMTRNLPYKITTVFDLFKERPERYIGAGFLRFLFLFASMIPMILGTVFFYFEDISVVSILVYIVSIILSSVLAILVAFHYAFVFFFLLDYRDMKVKDAFAASRQLMKGNKGRYFYLILSFLGWSLTILFSLGIASLWVAPYMTQTLVFFYMDCTGEADHLLARDFSNNQTAGFGNSAF